MASSGHVPVGWRHDWSRAMFQCRRLRPCLCQFCLACLACLKVAGSPSVIQKHDRLLADLLAGLPSDGISRRPCPSDGNPTTILSAVVGYDDDPWQWPFRLGPFIQSSGMAHPCQPSRYECVTVTANSSVYLVVASGPAGLMVLVWCLTADLPTCQSARPARPAWPLPRKSPQ